MDRIIIGDFSHDSVLHPDDVKLMHSFRKIPGFDKMLKLTVEKYQNLMAKIMYEGNGYALNENSAPAIFDILKRDCEILGIRDMPLLSASRGYLISSFSVGGDPLRIVLSTGSIDLLTPRELDFIIGHELGHIVLGHLTYHMLVESLYTPLLNIPEFKPVLGLIRMKMLDWYRTSHLSADRVGLLCCQDINLAIGVMIKMSGLPKKYYDHLDTKNFLKQGKDFEIQHGGKLNDFIKKFTVKCASSPWLVVRAKSLYDWWKSGEYDKIIEKGTK